MQNERVRRNLADIHAFLSKTEIGNGIGKICEIHYHDEIELILITGGSLKCCVDGGQITAECGEVIFVDSRIPHWTESASEDCVYILLQFIPDEFEPGGRGVRNASHPLYRFARTGAQSAQVIRDSAVVGALQNIWAEYVARKEGAGKFILSDLYYLIGWLERGGYLSADALPDDQSLQKLFPALDYIDRNYQNPELSLEEVSAVMGLNAAYFCRLFKRVSGRSFTEYLNFVRISKSEELLQNTAHTILEISMEVGFSSVSYYNRVFKQLKNCTPSVYRSAQYSAM